MQERCTSIVNTLELRLSCTNASISISFLENETSQVTETLRRGRQNPFRTRTQANRIKIKIRWWRHQMEPFCALLAICAGNSPSPVNSPHKGQWRGALMFSLICVWINDWVNNREAGDLKCYRAHYDVIVVTQGTALSELLLHCVHHHIHSPTAMGPTSGYRGHIH